MLIKNLFQNPIFHLLLKLLAIAGSIFILFLAGPGCGSNGPIPPANAGGMDETAGSTGFVNALDFEADWTNQPNQELTTAGLFPVECRTGEYLAGPNEVAVFNISAFVGASTGGANNFLQLKAAMSDNGGPFTTVSALNTIDSLEDDIAHVSTTKKIDLQEGHTYVFGAQFSAGNTVIMSFSTCHGTVIIGRVEIAP